MPSASSGAAVRFFVLPPQRMLSPNAAPRLVSVRLAVKEKGAVSMRGKRLANNFIAWSLCRGSPEENIASKVKKFRT